MTNLGDTSQQIVRLPQLIHDLLSQALLSSRIDSNEHGLFLAQKAAVFAPDDPNVLYSSATILSTYGMGAPIARKLLERVLEIQSHHHEAIVLLYKMMRMSGEYELAIQYAQKLVNGDSNPSPLMHYYLARAYQQHGNEKQAKTFFRKVINAKPQYFDKNTRTLKPLAEYHGGWQVDAEDSIKQICTVEGKGTYSRDQKIYPNSIVEQLQRLQEITRGKDILIYGNAPSVEAIVNDGSFLRGKDIVHMGLNNFSIVGDEIFKKWGLRTSLVCLSHSGVMFANAEAIGTLVQQPYPTMVLLNSSMLSYFLERMDRQYISKLEERMFNYRLDDDFLPTPENPLNLPNINTLFCALCVAILGCPRRVFLLGCDQKATGDKPQKQGALYFRFHDERYKVQSRTKSIYRESTGKWLRWDAERINETALITLRMLSLMFNVEQPPIYNVSPDSALDVFPQIDFNTFKDLIVR